MAPPSWEAWEGLGVWPVGQGNDPPDGGRAGGLTPAQRRIMHYIMANYEEAIFLTASELAQSVGVSEATVVRLAQALGFDGYPSMQKRFRQGLQNRLSTVTRLEQTVDHVKQVGDVVVKVLQEDMHNLSQTLRDLPIEVFERAVADMQAAEKIFVVGLRGAHAPALTLGTYLRFLGKENHLRDFGIFQKTTGPSGRNNRFTSVAVGRLRPLGVDRSLPIGLFYRVIHGYNELDQRIAYGYEYPDSRRDLADFA